MAKYQPVTITKRTSFFQEPIGAAAGPIESNRGINDSRKAPSFFAVVNEVYELKVIEFNAARISTGPTATLCRVHFSSTFFVSDRSV